MVTRAHRSCASFLWGEGGGGGGLLCDRLSAPRSIARGRVCAALSPRALSLIHMIQFEAHASAPMSRSFLSSFAEDGFVVPSAVRLSAASDLLFLSLFLLA